MMPCAGSSSTIDALDLVEEDVAIANAGAERGRSPAPRQRPLHPVFAQRVRARPFRRSGGWCGPGPAPRARLCAAQRSEHAGSAGGIVAGRDHVAQAKRVGLIFLLAREAQQVELRARRVQDLVRSRRRRSLRRSGRDTPSGLRSRILLADVGVVGGDMPDFMAEREGELRLVVHQRHQLAGDVDIAARHREARFRPPN